MKKIYAAVCLAALRTASLSAEIKPAGYMSLEYLKGQELSPYSRGSIQNLGAGLMLSGILEGGFDFNLETRFRGSGGPDLEQAWVGFVPSQAFHLRLGLYLVPFGKYNQVNRPHQTVLVSDPFHVGGIFPTSWRDLGATIEGRTQLFNYAAYIGNGLREGEDLKAGQQFADNNANKAMGGRVGVSLSQQIELGASYSTGKYDDADQRSLVLEGADFSWATSSFYVLAEYSRAHIENPAPFAKGKAESILVQLSMDYGSLKPVVSFQKMTYKDAFHGPGFSALQAGPGIFQDGKRWSIGGVYYLSTGFLLKVEYDFNREAEGELKNNVFMAQVAVQF